jgi:hypothetical protein
VLAADALVGFADGVILAGLGLAGLAQDEAEVII